MSAALPAHLSRDKTDDLTALAWVHEELRRSLEIAHKSLRRHLKEADGIEGADGDAADLALLRQAQAHLHQGVGALELVGLPSAALLLRAAEGALDKLAGARRLTGAAVDTLEFASFALMDYLQRLLAGKPVSPLLLFPQYRAVQEMAGAERVHPADLWPVEWRWREIPADSAAQPRLLDAEARTAIEGQTLALMRQPDGPAAQQLSDLFAGLGAGARELHAVTLWKLAGAFFEAQAHRLLRPDVHTKRIAARLLAQLRLGERDPASLAAGEPTQRLAHDLLFFCAQSLEGVDAVRTPRLVAVRSAWSLPTEPAYDYESSRLGRFDPAWVAQARKRVAAARDAWSAVAGGELLRLPSLTELFSLAGESLRRLYPSGDRLAAALHDAVAQTADSGQAPPAGLAMEVATSVLYLDASLEDADFDRPDEAQRVERLAQRIDAARQGLPAQPLDAWMEELYRRVSDRQTMGSVVQELRASIAESEKQIDQYFRSPAQRDLLVPVPGQLQAMRGVLSVLGLDQASQTVLRMRDDVDALLQADAQALPDTALFDRLAANLGMLGFLIDMLSVQPHVAKSLFAFDADSGLLRSIVGGGAAYRVAAPAAAAAEPVREPFEAGALPDLSLPDVPAIALPEAAPLPDAFAGEDDDLREVFLEEAREVLQGACGALEGLDQQPDDLGRLTVLRRAFHTLKGSGRMVGLTDLGEAAWSAEQLYNARLASDPQADAPLLGATADILSYLSDWVECVAVGRDGGHRASAVQQVADALRLQDRREPLALPSAALPVSQVVPEPTGPVPLIDVGGGSEYGALESVLTEPVDRKPPDVWTPEDTVPAAPSPLLAAVPDLPAAHDLDLDFSFELGGDGPAPAVPSHGEAAALSDPEDGVDLVFEPLMTSPMPLVGVAEEPAPAPAPQDAPLPAPEASVLVDAWPSIAVAEAPADLALPELPAVVPLPESQAFLPEEALRLQPMEDWLTLDLGDAADLAAPAPPTHEPLPEASGPAHARDDVKHIGPLAVPLPLFNIFLSEADEQSRRLGIELAEWALELHRPVGEAAVSLAHSLAGNSATVGFAELSQLARLLEHTLAHAQRVGRGDGATSRLFNEASDEIRGLLHQFAAGFLKGPSPELMARLQACEQRLAEAAAPASAGVDTASGLEGGTGTVPGTLSGLLDETPAQRPPEDAAVPQPPAEPPAPPLAASSVFGELQPEIKPLLPAEEPSMPQAGPQALDAEDGIDAVDAVDGDLFPIFDEEAQELLPQLAARLRDWAQRPDDPAGASACMRTLHTLKGGARLAGAMRLGEMAHRLETAIEHLLARGDASTAEIDMLQGRVDALNAAFEALQRRDRPPAVAAESPLDPMPAPVPEAAAPADAAPPEWPQPLLQAPAEPMAWAPGPAEPPAIDWSRFAAPPAEALVPAVPAQPAASQAPVRVRAPLLDRLVNHAGEVSITRTRMEADLGTMKGSLGDLTDNLERLRRQLRDLELQSETHISSRIEATKAAAEVFDPLELDRFTRFQELTRMIAESVNDVATVQRSLQRALQSAEDELAAQARLTRDLQDDLLRTRMVEFESIADRLYRVVRQASKETGKPVRLDIVGGAIEVDRGVLDRMTGAFEHLLRNCVVHGIEEAGLRAERGKDPAGRITISLTHAGNEVGVEVRDDGGGLDLLGLRQRGVELGLLAEHQQLNDAELAQLVFSPGLTTAREVTELAGRGVGMDVVRSEVLAMGGRIETATAWGQGTSFRLVLPLTTAVTQVVMLRAGRLTVAVPSPLVEAVRRVPAEEVTQGHAEGHHRVGEQSLPFFWLGGLLQDSPRGADAAGTQSVVVIRSAQQRVVVHVDEVLGNHEVVVKNLGPQLSRLPGLVGVTLLATGLPTLIYNPVALAALYGDAAQAEARGAAGRPSAEAAATPRRPQAPLVLVVDDSLTVRRVTQRLLLREGYRVELAKDGVEGLEKLGQERPAVLLTDIEMPRMDGFDLVRQLRGEARLQGLPVIMITSRIAQKHRDVAAELGVDHYLGKPYSEEELLALVARYAGTGATQAA
ncbi:Hpt domain-containing protein [Aquincola sp. MAHUQ-54]|uniref:Chemotaxis protein CheA n=1 Tax=Aquincola agrisoli TaxID=3119538 RepID=A0AAW9QJM0_9BURK